MRNVQRLVSTGLTLLAGIGAVSGARAQTAPNVEIPRFSPSYAGDRFFGVASPYATSPDDFGIHGGLVFDYALNPLVAASANGEALGCGGPECAVVANQLLMHVNATGTLFNRFALNLDLPVALFQSGDGSVADGTVALTSPDGAALGDLRVGVRGRILGEYDDPLQLGLGANVWVPTGTPDAAVSDGSVRAEPHVLVGGKIDRFLWTASVGSLVRESGSLGAVSTGTQLRWGAGVGALLLDEEVLQVGLESTGGLTVTDIAGNNTNAELQAGAKYRIADVIELGLAAGPGLAGGIGTPQFRGLLSAQYTTRPPLAKQGDGDGDGDGIADGVDACPSEKGVASDDPKLHGCPKPAVLDKDGDSIPDASDACPDTAGAPSDDPKKNGCPKPGDQDGDGVTDDVDACRERAGVKSADPKKNGCPADTDEDGILDEVDACPKEKGVANEDPKQNGCPVRAVLTETEIVILEQVQFEADDASLKPDSTPLIEQVVKILRENPEITKLEVQGHTDYRGTNLVLLSQKRAKAVLDALVARGIEPSRLVSKGYGPTQPLDKSNNEAAWAKNRRVQFVVLKKGK
jgi:OOP family OmpA-OmpF porin